jgi:phosphoribosylformylglycinamidine synthase
MKGIQFVLPEVVEQKNLSVIEVGPFNEGSLAAELNRFYGIYIQRLVRTNSYILIHEPDVAGIERLLRGKPFVDPIVHQASLNEPLIGRFDIGFDYVLQSMLNPGTSDADGDITLRQTLLALGHDYKPGDIGFLSRQFFVSGDVSPEKLEHVSRFLANPDLNVRQMLTRSEYDSGRRIIAPVVTLAPEVKVERFDVANMSDDELLELSSRRSLAADLEEMHQFREMYKDTEFLKKRAEKGLDARATDVELETWFGLRSEHCFHKEFNAHITLEDRVGDEIFERAVDKGYLKRDESGNLILEDGLFKTFIQRPAEAINEKLEKRGNNWILSMFKDNSGVVRYNDKNMFCIKFETHNSPSNKEPVQGSKTGIDGVNRDIFGTMLGTFEAIANFFLYCAGSPAYTGWLPAGVKHPYVLLKGMTQGVREGGNESQIPTLGGDVRIDPRYIAKCLVYCGTVGFSPIESPEGISYLEKHPSVGDIIYVAGQAVGIDGVHGATESSLSASKKISLGHVQADFSFIQAKMKEYIVEVARDCLLSTIGDCGAMGIAAAHELAEATGGLVMDLGKHPRKYLGIQPWQVGCSETQDRMVLGSKPQDEEELQRRARKHDVDVTRLGEFTDTGYLDLRWEGDPVGLIDIKRLFNKEPRKRMHATWFGPGETDPGITYDRGLEETLCHVMEQPDVCSKEWFFKQKDSSVKGATILGPLLGVRQEVESDATVTKPLETEDEDFGAIAYAMGCAPKLSDLDAYYSAQRSFVDMVGKIVAVGGTLPDMVNPKWDAWAVCGNYCQPNSESRTTLIPESGEANLASLVREGIGIADAIEALNIPVISGKDSMKCSCVYEVDDDFDLEQVPADLRRYISIGERDGKRSIEIHDPDTYLASCAVKIDDYRKVVDASFKKQGDLIYVIGLTKNELAGSQLDVAMGYADRGDPYRSGNAPKVDFEQLKESAAGLHAAIDAELVASSAYIHNGGLAAALSKGSFASGLGAYLDVSKIEQDGSCETAHSFLFSETTGRFVVTVAEKDKAEFEKMLGAAMYSCVGRVMDSGLSVDDGSGRVEQIDLAKVKEHYRKPLSFGLN